MIHSLSVLLGLAAFGGGGGGTIDFANVAATGQNYGGNVGKFVVIVLVVLILAGIASVLATSRGKSDMVQYVALAAFVAVCVGVVVTWGSTAGAAACLLTLAPPGVSI